MERRADRIARRDFLKATSAAAGGFALVTRRSDPDAAPSPRDVSISAARYRAVPDYPIRPQRFSDVTLNDGFWKPRIAVNAKVTIPFEVQKLTDGGRGFGGNVLEAAILSLHTHPNPELQAQVDARIRALSQSPERGNGG